MNRKIFNQNFILDVSILCKRPTTIFYFLIIMFLFVFFSKLLSKQDFLIYTQQHYIYTMLILGVVLIKMFFLTFCWKTRSCFTLFRNTSSWQTWQLRVSYFIVIASIVCRTFLLFPSRVAQRNILESSHSFSGWPQMALIRK